MYPDRELARLAVRKAELRGSITLHRLHCAQAAGRVTEPLVWLDRALALWRKFSPIAKLASVPIGVLLPAVLFSFLKMRSGRNKSARVPV
jgi:hypothetical protein